MQLIRERVHDRDTDPVQTSGNFVGVLVELTTRVQHRQNDRSGTHPLCRVHVSRDTPSVVCDDTGTLFRKRDVDRVTIPRHRLIYRVVDNLINQVMQAAMARIADIHPRSFSDGFKSFEDLDITRTVILFFHVQLRLQIGHKAPKKLLILSKNC